MPVLHNPYPGIRPFRTEEGNLFFGREDNIAELKEKLSCRFLSIVGTSGSGKSSLVRAGLIPELLNDGWFVGIFRPQGEPIKNLKKALISDDVLGKFLPPNFSDGLDQHEAWEIGDYYSASGQDSPIVLVIDQFEEIFRFQANNRDAKKVANRFIGLLLNAISQSEYPIYVILTIRSEFLGRCSEFHGLTEWINKGQYLVPRMNRAQFEKAIVGFQSLPEYKEVKISQELVSKLLSEIGDDMDQLPVLQHALMKTWHEWEKGEDDEIGMEHYKVIGEMKASVSNHAQDILRELQYQGLENETRLIFQRITEIDYESNKVRNPTKLSVLVELNGGKQDEVIKIVEAFRAEGRNFIRPDYQVELEDETMIDVAHESLIRQWRTLGKWMREEAENAREYRLINQRQENQETEGLLLNPRLAISEYWWLGQTPTVTWASRYHSIGLNAPRSEHRRIFSANQKFLEESLEEQQRIDEANKTELERQKEQRFQRVVYLVAGLVIIALILGVFSRRNEILKNEALDSAKLATQEAQEAESARLEAINATEQALQEKAVADSLREEANQKTVELIVANRAADDLKNQAIEEREIAESRSIDARLAEFGALISESRAKANEIEANILKLTSEYKENIEKAKKQALVSIIMDDPEEQKQSALSSFEEFDHYNLLLMGLESPAPIESDRSIDYYISSIDSLRNSLQGIVNRANLWVSDIDTKVPANHITFRSESPCDIKLDLLESTSTILTNKLDSLQQLESSFESTCSSIDQIRTDREWENLYPIENHRALLESYNSSFEVSKSEITFGDLTNFYDGSIEVNFNIEDGPDQLTPKLVSVLGLDQIAYSYGNGTVYIENGQDKVEVNSEGGESTKYIGLLPDKSLVIAKSGSLSIVDYSHNPQTAIEFENGNGVIDFKSVGGRYLGLNTEGRILIWNKNGVLEDELDPLPGDLITAFDSYRYDGSDDILLALGTSNGRVHLFEMYGNNLIHSSIQLNRLYSGEEPAVKVVKFCPNGKFLVSSSSRQIDLWPLSYIDSSNKFQPIFKSEFSPEQISPVPMGRDESIQTSKGLTGITFDKKGDWIMYTNNSRIFTKPVNIYFICQSLGSEYCTETSFN